MIDAMRNYFTTLNASLGESWNRFWFTPRSSRVLGWIRVLVGIDALWLIASYRDDLGRLFTPQGMVPVAFVRDLFPAQYSLLDDVLADHAIAFWTLSLVILTVATLGVGGRLTLIAAWLASLSFLHRASLTNGPAEAVLAFLLPYLCIGRASESLSLSNWWNERRRRREELHPGPLVETRTVSNAISLRLVQLHVAIVYAMMATAQVAAQGGVWFSGEGMWLAAQSTSGSASGSTSWSWLAAAPKSTAAWSHLVTLFLIAFPIWGWRPLALPLLCIWGALVWLSIAAATGETQFALAMIAGSAAFLSSRVKT